MSMLKIMQRKLQTTSLIAYNSVRMINSMLIYYVLFFVASYTYIDLDVKFYLRTLFDILSERAND